MEHVNHPSHYNRHPKKIECIEIIRHYTCDIANAIKYLWRAGLKVPSKQVQCDACIDIAEREEARPIGQTEVGMEDAEKEIEDLKKALWYIADLIKNGLKHSTYMTAHAAEESRAKGITDRDVCIAQVRLVTGYHIQDIVDGYEENVHVALFHLLQVGLINYDGRIYLPRTWRHMLDLSTKAIQARILGIEHTLLDKELQETVDVLNGQAVDGEDYVSKPACVRKTEPDHYDPLNMIVAWGRVYSLTDEVRMKENGALYKPCDNCDLSEFCNDHSLCNIHGANTQQYFCEVGKAKYSPRFGTVEVIDETKEAALELKRIEKEYSNN